MKSEFPGFSREGIDFLRDLARNNDREWFAPRKASFEEIVRTPMLDLVGAIHRRMLNFAPAYVGDPAKCVFRIYRDTRFSKDKTPYKTHMAAVFWHNALEKRGAGYYFSVAPEKIEIAGGLYSPEPDALLAVRRRIAEHAREFKKTFTPGTLQGDSVSRPPRGFDPSHPDLDLIKRKQYCLFHSLDPALATTPKLYTHLVKIFESMAPFIDYLNAPLLPAKAAKPTGRDSGID